MHFFLANGIIRFWIVLFLVFAGEVRALDESGLPEYFVSQDCIINSRQIIIPGYPNAYNPSLISYKDGYLLSFRYVCRYPEICKCPFRNDISLLGIVQLDKNFAVMEETVHLLNIASYSSQFSLSAEDPRLLNIRDRIFLFFNDLPPLQIHGGYAMYFGELIQERGEFVLKEPAKLLSYAYARGIEKNWTPFVCKGKLYVIYSDAPRVILEVDSNTGNCQEVARTEHHWNWDFGEIRGGTPAGLIDDHLFLTVFHSSFPAETSKGRAYVMGAYVFDQEFPFSIRAITRVPLGSPSDYTRNNSSRIVFPGGIVFEDNEIHVAWGKADKQIFITTFDKKKLLASLVPPFQ